MRRESILIVITCVQFVGLAAATLASLASVMQVSRLEQALREHQARQTMTLETDIESRRAADARLGGRAVMIHELVKRLCADRGLSTKVDPSAATNAPGG